MEKLERVIKARAQLVADAPFFGCLALHLAMEESTEFDTMATDGEKLFINAEFVETLTDAELRGVVAHEVLHCASQHMTRLGNRDPETFNEAADFAINGELLSLGFTLPQGALVDSQYDGMTAEQIYGQLMRRPQKQKPGNVTNRPGAGNPGKNGNDPGKCGGIIKPGNDAKAAAIGADWQGKALMAAAIASKQAGTLPGSIARLVAALRATETPWREILRRFITESNSRDYSWSKPNRRHIGNGLYLPSLVSDGRGRIIVLVDTSGSIDPAALQAFQGELQAVLDERAADALTVVYCDARIQGVAEFESGDTVKLETIGGGGTDFAPAMQWASDNGHGAACVIYFTDLECYSFGRDPGLPVIWANWAKPRAVPFGEVVQIDGHA